MGRNLSGVDASAALGINESLPGRNVSGVLLTYKMLKMQLSVTMGTFLSCLRSSPSGPMALAGPRRALMISAMSIGSASRANRASSTYGAAALVSVGGGGCYQVGPVICRCISVSHSGRVRSIERDRRTGRSFPFIQLLYPGIRFPSLLPLQ